MNAILQGARGGETGASRKDHPANAACWNRLYRNTGLQAGIFGGVLGGTAAQPNDSERRECWPTEPLDGDVMSRPVSMSTKKRVDHGVTRWL